MFIIDQLRWDFRKIDFHETLKIEIFMKHL